jgi:hypothetical protein
LLVGLNGFHESRAGLAFGLVSFCHIAKI